MRLVQFVHVRSPQHLCAGVLQGDSVVDISHIASTTIELLRGGEKMESEVAAYLNTNPPAFSRDQINLKAPVTGMDKVLCIGMNYKDHCEEQGAPIPTEPMVFNKFPSCVVGPEDDIPFPPTTEQLDWEVEMVIVIGKKGFEVDEGSAMDYVYGYTTGNDLSAREWQLHRNGGQWMIGKGMNGFAPIGPSIVSKDEIADPQKLRVWCKVNGETKQDSNTSEMVFNVSKIVAWVTKFFTLLPGDIISTGTPPGVGVFRSPPQFLHKGDTVVCGVEGIGEIVNRIV